MRLIIRDLPLWHSLPGAEELGLVRRTVAIGVAGFCAVSNTGYEVGLPLLAQIAMTETSPR